MPRDIDQKKTRKALRKLRKAVERAEAEGVELTDWEKEFAEGVDERLNKYGSAFADLTKGEADEALSMAQSEILRQLDKKREEARVLLKETILKKYNDSELAHWLYNCDEMLCTWEGREWAFHMNATWVIRLSG